MRQERGKTNGEPLKRIVHPSDFSQSSRVAFCHASNRPPVPRGSGDCPPAESDRGNRLRHRAKHPPDLLVLATRQREGLSRWLHKLAKE